MVMNRKETWWYAYRRAKNRPRHQLSLEMICRKSLSEVWRDYLKHCSIAGVKQIREKNVPIKHRFIWLLILGATMSTTVYMLMNILSGTLTKPLIVTMDSSTYPIAEIDFPAIAICNINRISRKSVKDFARYIYLDRNKTLTLDSIEWYLLQGGRLLDYSYNETLRLRLLQFVRHDSSGNKHDIIEGMRRLAPDCNEMLLRCSWHGKIVNCSDIFAVRRTVLGHCCAFNYVLEYNSIGRPGRAKKLIGKVMRQKQAGWRHGLTVVLDPLLKDYAYPLRNVEGFDILLFDPTHFADPSGGRVLQRVVQPNDAMIFHLQSVKQVATAEVRKYPLSVRKCLFNDELPDLYGEMYSYSACLARCKFKTLHSLCKCTPYFLPMAESGVPVCSLVDLPCLNKYKEKLLSMYPFYASSTVGLEYELLDSLFCQECLPDCELTKHTVKSSRVRLVDTKLGDKALIPLLATGLNTSNICIVYIFQGTNDGVLDRLDVVYYWYEILSNIGGFAGILVGFSIISVVEIIYYFIVRFIVVFCTNFKLYH